MLNNGSSKITDPTINDEVILVDENDREIGAKNKMPAHRDGDLHRCFSIFVFNARGELMLQRRASGKYHSGGLWTNTCCSHPRSGEETVAAGHRKLQQEMGFDCGLKEVFTFIYRAPLGDLTEHEFDHVLFGRFEGEPKPNPAEAEGWKWVGLDELAADIAAHPASYTEWLKIALPKVVGVVKNEA